jgi:hypothetical protein
MGQNSEPCASIPQSLVVQVDIKYKIFGIVLAQKANEPPENTTNTRRNPKFLLDLPVLT